ncbi:hypothetical protein CC78DRAFT_618274 [Lojkania enalia]|uniref:LIM zinc-binding domain-containing protein n=1 Tax=Lojkania enalia TaxID=147567 RepID=A0A9P4N511_9PLEO|nr:hypothetical protein CC78DRAFT_618274 [Didymosphaeria enalia]
MDPLSACAAAIGAVAQAIEISVTMYNLIDGIRTMDENIKRLSSELRALHNVLGLLSASLEAQKFKAHQEGFPVHMINNIKELVMNCISVFHEIQEVIRPHLQPETKMLKVWKQGIKWEIGKKQNLTTLQTSLSNNKATLELAISTLNLFNSSQTVDMVANLQRDVRRLRRQIKYKDQIDSGGLGALNSSYTPQAPPAYDPYNASMERFLARTASVASRMSTSTRLGDLDSIFTDEFPKDADSDFYAEPDPSEGPYGLNAEYFSGTEKVPAANVTGLEKPEEFDNSDRDLHDIGVFEPNASKKQWSWKKFRYQKKKDLSGSSFDSDPESELRAMESIATTRPPMPLKVQFQPLYTEIPKSASDEQLNQPPTTLEPEPPSLPPQPVPPEGPALQKSITAPSISSYDLPAFPYRSVSTPSYLRNDSETEPRLQNPYFMPVSSSRSQSPENFNTARPLITDRDRLLSSNRQPSIPELPAEAELQTNPQTPCRSCKSVIGKQKHYKLQNEAWHAQCFRCSSCNILLNTSTPPPFLLKDDFLVCTSCSFNCQKCDQRVEEHGHKDALSGSLTRIQDIVTASCPGLFFCHECFKSIKNLRYTRTTQGIFCMGCHNPVMSDMERVRKEREREGKGRRAVPVLVG